MGALNLVFSICKSFDFNFSTFFQIQEFFSLAQNLDLNQIHTTHSQKLKIVWVQSFTTNKNKQLWHEKLFLKNVLHVIL
jgi:hypothetical protein